MAVTDRWHLTYPKPGPQGPACDQCRHRSCQAIRHGIARSSPCKCGTRTRPLYPTAEHLKGKRWQVRYRDDTGKQTSRNFALKDGKNPETHADAFDADVNAKLNSGTYLDPSAGEISLKEFALGWLANQTGDPATLRPLRDRVAHICEVGRHPGQRWPSRRKTGPPSPIESLPVRVLARRPSLIQGWIKHLDGKGLDDYTQQMIVNTLSAIFQAAIDDELVARNPVTSRAVKRPKRTKKRIVPWTLEQIDAAAAHLGLDDAMVYLGVGAGLRQGEIFGLAVDDIDFFKKEINISRQVRVIRKADPRPDEPVGLIVFSLPKSKKERTVPISDALMLKLSERIRAVPATTVTLPWAVEGGEAHTADLLFARADGRPHTHQSYSYIWHGARDAAGVPATPANGMHVLRHTYATTSLSNGVDLAAVSAFLGHANISTTTDTYVHYIPKADHRAREVMDDFLRGRLETLSALDVPAPEETGTS